MCVRALAHVCVRVCGCARALAHVCVPACVCVRACVRAYVRACVRACVCVCEPCSDIRFLSNGTPGFTHSTICPRDHLCHCV